MRDATRLRVLATRAPALGSVTAAALEMTTRSRRSAHPPFARLEAETGAQLVQRAGRGIPPDPKPAGCWRPSRRDHRPDDAADAELPAHVGLSTGRVRLAGFASRDQLAGARAARPSSSASTRA